MYVCFTVLHVHASPALMPAWCVCVCVCSGSSSSSSASGSSSSSSSDSDSDDPAGSGKKAKKKDSLLLKVTSLAHRPGTCRLIKTAVPFDLPVADTSV